MSETEVLVFVYHCKIKLQEYMGELATVDNNGLSSSNQEYSDLVENIMELENFVDLMINDYDLIYDSEGNTVTRFTTVSEHFFDSVRDYLRRKHDIDSVAYFAIPNQTTKVYFPTVNVIEGGSSGSAEVIPAGQPLTTLVRNANGVMVWIPYSEIGGTFEELFNTP